MNGANIITLIAQTGGTMGLAIFAIWMLNRVWEDRIKAAERYAADLRIMWEQMRLVLDQNTTAIVQLTDKLEHLDK